MAALYRLILACLLLCCGAAHALVPVVTSNGYRIPAGSNPSIFPTREAACNAQVVNWGMPGWTTTGNYVTDGGSYCRINSSEGTQVVWAIEVASSSSCPDHSAGVGDGANCSCVTGYVEQGGACVPKPKVCMAGQVFSERSVRQYPPTADGKPSEAAKQDLVATPPSCYDQCALDYAPGEGRTRGERDAATHAWSIVHPKVIQTGANCTSSAQDAQNGLKWDEFQQTSTPAPTPCPAGTLAGDVNGTSVCKPSGASASASGSSSSSSGNEVSTGGSSGSSGGSGSNGNGSGSGATVIGTGGASNSGNTQITVCDQTSCTTTSTSTSTASGGTGTAAGGSGGSGGGGGNGTNSNGQQNGSSTQDCAKDAANSSAAAAGGATCTNSTTTTKPVGEYCKEHPGDTACANKVSSFGGNCASGFTAKSEDAVLNAMAQEQFTRNCQTLGTDTEHTNWATAEGQRTDDRTANNPHNFTVTVSASDIDTSDALGGGASCPANRFVQIAGQSVSMPFGKVCGALEMLGTVLLGFAFLMGGRIVMRG